MISEHDPLSNPMDCIWGKHYASFVATQYEDVGDTFENL